MRPEGNAKGVGSVGQFEQDCPREQLPGSADGSWPLKNEDNLEIKLWGKGKEPWAIKKRHRKV